MSESSLKSVSQRLLANDTDHYSFSGHETFPFRYTWLPKGIQGVSEYPNLFTREDAMVILGVGKNMVAAIRHWCEVVGLIELTDRGRLAAPTRLGEALLSSNGWDPYLEDPGTLWLLHWLLISCRNRASTWYLAFTQFNADVFTREDLVQWLLRIVANAPSTRATPASLKRDVEVFLRTYVPAHQTRDLPLEETFDCPLVELGLIREVERGSFQFARGPKPSLPDLIFVYALADFWQRTALHQRTLSFESILHGAGSPGAGFKISENALMERLEQLPHWSGLTYDDTAGIRQILRTDSQTNLDLLSILERYYRDPLSGSDV
jgi:hypothetical protein